ncbi:hypothetical protein ABZ858_13655 [Streptomyces sp. NPDC047017]|uniref:TetR/AcrR family transcriptional regulator C-terminal domain-containing protein n=1 Tax=Streptomyces sp. NPDC047017 TaxID=3155024 RepID=UPI0033E85DBD
MHFAVGHILEEQAALRAQGGPPADPEVRREAVSSGGYPHLTAALPHPDRTGLRAPLRIRPRPARGRSRSAASAAPVMRRAGPSGECRASGRAGRRRPARRRAVGRGGRVLESCRQQTRSVRPVRIVPGRDRDARPVRRRARREMWGSCHAGISDPSAWPLLLPSFPVTCLSSSACAHM